MAFSVRDGHLVAYSDLLEIIFDRDSGGIRQMRHLGTGQVLVDADPICPWRLPSQAGGSLAAALPIPAAAASTTATEYAPESFSFSLSPDGNEANLEWTTTDPGVSVGVTARLGAEGALELWPSVRVSNGCLPPRCLEYPVLSSPCALSEDDRLAFPAQSGWLFRDPLEHSLESFYPDGYDGCSLQFMAYYAATVGGFYLACHDPHSTSKSLRFTAAEIAFAHDAWDLREGASLELDYPVVLAALVAGDWYEAADRYRRWAVAAPWASAGVPNLHRHERDGARWLYDEVMLSIWGTPASLDWSAWYRFYADAAGGPLHICAGWDWPASRPHTVGPEGWFPARFHPANVECWRGHRVTPYMNDLFISTRAADFDERWEPNLLFPYVPFLWSPFSAPRLGWVDGHEPTPDPTVTTNLDYFLCPATSAHMELHAWRDTALVRDYGLDGVCYDISSGNPRRGSQCLRADHGHPPGSGRLLVQAYEALNRRSKDAVAAETGRYLVQGVETIIENVAGSVDFYVSRACSGPLGVLEAWTLGPEDPPGGTKELIPLFQSVYHDIGPVHEDGWLTLSAAEGDLFFWVAARIVLQWGGLLSLHYANNPPERLPGQQAEAEVINWDGSLLTFTELPDADPRKIDFARELGRARIGFANRFLAYGQLVRPPAVDVGAVTLGFRREYSGTGIVTEGTWDVPEVVHGAWLDVDGNVGIVFANVNPSRPVVLPVRANAAELWGVELADGSVCVVTSEGSAPMRGAFAGPNVIDVSLDLPPLTVTLVRAEAAR